MVKVSIEIHAETAPSAVGLRAWRAQPLATLFD